MDTVPYPTPAPEYAAGVEDEKKASMWDGVDIKTPAYVAAATVGALTVYRMWKGLPPLSTNQALSIAALGAVTAVVSPMAAGTVVYCDSALSPIVDAAAGGAVGFVGAYALTRSVSDAGMYVPVAMVGELGGRWLAGKHRKYFGYGVDKDYGIEKHESKYIDKDLDKYVDKYIDKYVDKTY